MLGGLDVVMSAGGGIILGLIKSKIESSARIREKELDAQLKREGIEIQAVKDAQQNYKVDDGKGVETTSYIWGLYKSERYQRDKAILPPYAFSLFFLSACIGLGIVMCFYLADLNIGPIDTGDSIATTKFLGFERTVPASSDSPRTMASIGRDLSMAVIAIISLALTGSSRR